MSDGPKYVQDPDLDHDNPNRERGKKVTCCYMFLFEYPGGAEGLAGMYTPDLGSLPAVVTDERGVKMLKPVMQVIARQQGRKVKLIRLTNREDIEEYGP